MTEAHGARAGAKVAAVSPHLDDVALGCAGFVAAHPGAVVVTVTAGKPGPHVLTDWDGKCGFQQDDDVVGERRREDEAALSMLGARPAWLEFLDHQYGPQAQVSEVAAALEHAITEFGIVASPLGLGHDDHVLTATACLEVARRHREVEWVLYEDVIYRHTIGGAERALDRLREQGFSVEATTFSIAPDAKRQAIDAYASQVKGLGVLLEDAYRPERYWRLVVETERS